MKLLAVLFLVGFALAAAVPLPSHDLSVDNADDLKLLDLALRDEDDVGKEVADKLREQFNQVLEKIKERLEKGREIKEELIQQLKDVREKMKDKRVEMGNKAKEMIQKLREKGKEFFQKILERLGLQKRDANDEPNTELGKRLREEFDTILEKIKDSIDKGKTLKEDYIEKLKELREQMKDLKIDIGKRAKDLLENIKDKAKDYWNKIWERLRPESGTLFAEGDEDEEDNIQTELGKKLKKHLDEILEQIKDAIDNGKTVKEDTLTKLRDIRDKMKEIKVEISKKARDLIDRIKEGSKEYLKKILDKLGLGKRAIEDEVFYNFREKIKELKEKLKRKSDRVQLEKVQNLEAVLMLVEDGDDDNDDGTETELGKTLRKHLDELLERIKDAIDHGKTVKDNAIEEAKKIREKLKELKEDYGKKAKDLIEKIKEGGKDYLKKILDRLGLGKRAIAIRADEDSGKVKEKIEEIINKIKDALENGGNLKEALDKLKEFRQKLKDRGVDMGDKIKEHLKNLRQRIRDYFDKLREKLGKEKKAIDWREKLRELRNRVLNRFDPDSLREYVEKIFGKGNEWSEKLLNKLKDKGESAKQRLIDLIDKYLKDQEEKRSIKDVYEKVKNYFKDLQVELKEKFLKFGEWAVAKYEKGLEKGKDKAENLKKLAREFISDAKNLSKEVADQAKEFFREYKDDLGTVYDDVREKIKEIFDRKEE